VVWIRCYTVWIKIQTIVNDLYLKRISKHCPGGNKREVRKEDASKKRELIQLKVVFEIATKKLTLKTQVYCENALARGYFFLPKLIHWIFTDSP
jgi:hypothetical protein